jgi:superoxide dismutase, Cu-Zn family
MRWVKALSVILLLTISLAFFTSSVNAGERNMIRARASIQGPAGSPISGQALLIQQHADILPTVRVIAQVRGLPPNSIHGFHIHEIGSCTPDFSATGGHFDPGPSGNSNPDANHPFHMGDIPNLVADAYGSAAINHVTSRITLSSGPLSLFDENGSAVIVHQNADQGTTGVTGGSGGPRIGCGVFQLAD